MNLTVTNNDDISYKNYHTTPGIDFGSQDEKRESNKRSLCLFISLCARG